MPSCRRRQGDHAFWRKLQLQDEELYQASHDFLRILYALCESDGKADMPNQLALLEAMRLEAERLQELEGPSIPYRPKAC